MPTLLERAADAAIALGAALDDPAVRDKTADAVLDVLGAALARSGSDFATRLDVKGRHPTAEDTALVTGALAHSMIREDMHLPSGCHIGVVVVPAVLAAGRASRCQGRRLMHGALAGYHVSSSLGRALRTATPPNDHFRPTGLAGPAGAAVGAAIASGLDRDGIVTAMALALNMSGGVNEWAWAGTEEIFLHAGLAARGGVTASRLAASGVRAATTSLEGQDGFFAAMNLGVTAQQAFLDALSLPPAILEVTHKPVPGCNFVQTPIAATLRLVADGVRPEAVSAITIETFGPARRYPGCDHAGPFATAQQAKMSLQYAVAAALLRGRADEEGYAILSDPELDRLIAATDIVEREDFLSAFPSRQPARVVVTLKDNSRHAAELPDVPWLASDGVRARFLDEAGKVLPQTRAEGLSRRILDLADETGGGIWDDFGTAIVPGSGT